jgi:hypothetical protein
MLKFLQNSLHKQFAVPRIAAFLFVLMTCSAAMAQELQVSGKVTSGEDQSPLPGVNILVKGTTSGTISDANGAFTINVSSGNDVLVFSFVGFMSQEVPIGGRTSFDVTLASDAKQLSEIVITALGIEKDKKALGYATQNVDGSQLVQARETNLVSGLAGKVAGVNRVC